MQQCIFITVIYAFFHSFCLLRKAIQPSCVIIVREHCFWAGLTMKVTCKSSIGDHWWQYSEGSWDTSAKCVMGAGKGDLKSVQVPRKSKLKVPVSWRNSQKYYYPIRTFVNFAVEMVNTQFIRCNHYLRLFAISWLVLATLLLTIIYLFKVHHCHNHDDGHHHLTESYHLQVCLSQSPQVYFNPLCVFLDTTTYSIY